jgi:hypothetical protein
MQQGQRCFGPCIIQNTMTLEAAPSSRKISTLHELVEVRYRLRCSIAAVQHSNQRRPQGVPKTTHLGLHAELSMYRWARALATNQSTRLVV